MRPPSEPAPAGAPAPRRNLELKAQDPNPEAALAACRTLGAEDHGWLRQRDTYFRVPRGRLKLREEEDGAHLIHYERTDEAVPRPSDFRLVPMVDPQNVRAALGAALGLDVVVVKQRRLFLWRGVRIHLDQVEGLGTFIELEAPAGPEAAGNEPATLIRTLLDALAITSDRVLGAGYADLLREGGRTIAGA